MSKESASFAIGIDLGTTHCALSYVELDLSEGEEVAQHVLEVPQSVAPAQIESRALLPSFLYLPHPGELAPGALALPWSESPPQCVGELARALGSKTPIRLVSSAKSWLCHPGVDRRAPILPAGLPPDASDVPRISPLQASIQYLEHLRDAWNTKHPEAPIEEQDVVITVPASFDPAARELTAEAAREAGLGGAVLLEEPQSALYSWIQRTHGKWREQVKVGDVILVVDLGGGTTDFSLIAVLQREGNLELHRVAVGDHILLGGDNMDLALAHTVRVKLEAEGHSLDAWQVQALTHACRGAKEQLLGESPAADSVAIVVPSRGSKLIGGSLRTELTRAEVERVLVEGFFPVVDSKARPMGRARGALTQIGLPFAQDPGVTRHLAAFLGKQIAATEALEGFRASAPDATFIHPTAVLFNGGVLKSPVLASRIVEVLNAWLQKDGAPRARVLEGADLDLAVARGAAYYAYVRRGRGVRIRGGTAMSYYVGIEAAMPAVPGMEPPVSALCVAPFGMEEGTEAPPAPQELALVVGEPVQFRFFGSSVRREDEPGTLIERWQGEVEELPRIETTLTSEGRTPGDLVPVRLRASVTEVGTLSLDVIARDGERWHLELDVRDRAG
ncbi:Hsp70 family protein [Sandaracinus amylolyticus]|uniref:DnaK-related protein n=1 Tax=Sandaracinus amylolyticus TaxID=927083 RepID=A0A0F6YN90_9BACT|nr:Hsp70 family protein [Sandaracinus amylolyticus]AKF11088.1 DnaK-related protein [Sandaracinus amylolyticus]